LASVTLGSSVLQDAPTDMYIKAEVNPLVMCMFITGDESMNITCLGCVGAKGEKFYTKPKLGAGELDTCGVNAHSKKAVTQPEMLYFEDGLKFQGFMTPALSTGFELANNIWDMQWRAFCGFNFNNWWLSCDLGR
jgi:hypothetical protein